MKQQNIIWHTSAVSRSDRERKNDHRSCVLWFTGLSGSGKSTLAHAVEKELHDFGYNTYVLDGDNIRHGLCVDLKFSEADRRENIRRIGEVAKLFLEAGVIVLAAFISPYRTDRENIRAYIGNSDFIEVYCKCPIEVCEQRDIKGLYKKARQGSIDNFTGISNPYEEPTSPEIVIETSRLSIQDGVNHILQFYKSRFDI